ncbi:MAG: hypothetical protein GXY76_07165 [Chloroflexi bacterium]|nr:hypothetical protein [Chloroflexota bacterium]
MAALLLSLLSLSACRVLGRPIQPGTMPEASLTSVTNITPGAEAATWTLEPSPTPSLTPTPTHTPIPPTNTPVPPTATPAIVATATAPPPATATVPSPTPLCQITPQWGIGDVWSQPEVRERVGCPVGSQQGITGEEIYFQGGHMLWRPDNGLIYVLTAPYMQDGWGAFPDTYQPSDLWTDPALATPTPRIGAPKVYQPTGRFGKLWRQNPWMQTRLNWAILMHGETEDDLIHTFAGVVQDCERGLLFWNGNVCFVLYTDDMSWTIY